MKDYTPDLHAAFQAVHDLTGYTDRKTGYLGKNDGTNTVVDPDMTANRQVFYYEKHGDRALPYSSAILLEGAGIYYEDSATNKDRPVLLAKPPGSKIHHVIGLAQAEAYNSSAGLTPLEQRIGAGGGGGAPTNATYILQTANAFLASAQAMGALATGIVKNTTGTGVQSIAAGSDLNTTFGSQAQNAVYAAPSGSAGTPTFRALVASDIPNLDTSKLTSGILGLARGGTGADLSATGGANQFVKQSSGGAVFTVAAILSADLTTALTTPPNIGLTTPADGQFNALYVKNTEQIIGNAGTFRVLWWYSSTSPRWALSANDTAESGSDAGSDFVLRAYNDAGTAATFTALTVTRATSQIALKAQDATTNSVLDTLTLRRRVSAGTPSAGFGPGLRFQAQDSAFDDQDVARWIAPWADGTHATRQGELKGTVFDTTNERTMLDLIPTGVTTPGLYIVRSPSWNLIIPGGYGMIVPYSYDLPAGVTLEVSVNGVFEVT